jgi:Gas vesicle synthesis protein GvpL/GvpF
VLAYCIAEQQQQIEIPHAGVEGAPIRWIDLDGLRCFVSDCDAQMPRERVPEIVKAFNEVLQRIFAQTTIIPFRFPTIIENEADLKEFVNSRSGEYRNALQRLRDKVQMDVRITTKPERAETSPQSGKAYLKQRSALRREAQSILEEFRRVSHSVAEEWGQGESTGGIRAFALIERASLPMFLEEIAKVPVPAGISARVTGPWPPSEFIELFTREPHD